MKTGNSYLDVFLYLASAIFALVAYIHNRDLKDIKDGIQVVDTKVSGLSDRTSKLEAKADSLDEKHKECLDDRSDIHSRITRAQGSI